MSTLKHSIHYINHILLKLLFITGVSLLFVSCENDIQKINSITNTAEMPEISADNVEIIYSDSGFVKVKLTAEVIKQYAKVEKPYMEFPEGIYVRFYNDSLNVESEIRANYAIYHTNEKLWEARGNVIANNLEKGEKLNTEELFWDENKRMIYSNSFSRIETQDGTWYGQDGFESNQRFSKWKLKGSRGTAYFKDKPANEQENP
ncbi:MAG TPA: LPS export ABC transporter periplasmic protein LptC [Bacteroidales bacterium]|nr:LPS export ABC transporter periplasmic protein LptC [Bacteroidales bacterium]